MAQLEQPMVEESRSEYSPRGFFTGIVLAFALLGVSGSALAFDGSTYLYDLLERQTPGAPYDRYVNVPLQWVVLMVSHLTSDLAFLRATFGLMYATVPVIALGMSWQVLRRRTPQAFIWPVLGITFGSVWMQFVSISEAIIVVQLSWPILLAMAVGTTLIESFGIVALIAAVCFSHPFAIPLLAACILVAFVAGLVDTRTRLNRWTWCCGLSVVLISDIFFNIYITIHNPYNTNQLTLASLQHGYGGAAAGLPTFSLSFAYIAALLIFLIPLCKTSSRPGLVYIMYAAELFCIVVAALVLVVWACSPSLWTYSLNFSRIVLLSSMPFMFLAALELLMAQVRSSRTISVDVEMRLRHRTRVITICGTALTLALIIQSVIWFATGNRLTSLISKSSYPCMSVASIPWARHTFLDYETLPAESILMQSRTPRAVIVHNSYCANASTVGSFAEAPDPLGDMHGWFNLSSLRSDLAKEQASPTRCWFVLTADWNPWEQTGSKWVQTLTSNADGRGRIRVFSPRPMRLRLSGLISNGGQPNSINILVNGPKQATITNSQVGFQRFTERSLSLVRGENVIAMVSHNLTATSVVPSPSSSIGVENLTLSEESGGARCEFRP